MPGPSLTTYFTVVLVALLSASCSEDDEALGLGVFGNAVFECESTECETTAELGSSVLGSMTVGESISVRTSAGEVVLADPNGPLQDSSGSGNFVGRYPGSAVLMAMTYDGTFVDYITVEVEGSSLDLVYACAANEEFNEYGHQCGQTVGTAWEVGNRVRIQALPQDEYTWSTPDTDLLRLDSGWDTAEVTMLEEGEATLVVSASGQRRELSLRIRYGPMRTSHSAPEPTGDDTGTTGDMMTTGTEETQ